MHGSLEVVGPVRKYLVPRNLRSGWTEYFQNIQSASEIFSPTLEMRGNVYKVGRLRRTMSDSTEQEDIIDWAIAYRTSGSYPRLLSKDQKRAVTRRALAIEVDNGEVYVQKLKRVKVIASRDEQVRILNSCHSDAISGHLGTRKTWWTIAERFYWKGLSYEVKGFVATCDVCQRMNRKLTTGVPDAGETCP